MSGLCSTSFDSIFPGFMMPNGSSACLIARINTTCPSRKSVAVDFLDRLGEPHQATPWPFRLAQRIENHEAHRVCVHRVRNHPAPLAPVSADRDRRIATSAGGL